LQDAAANTIYFLTTKTQATLRVRRH
jgi:hypothetical protein